MSRNYLSEVGNVVDGRNDVFNERNNMNKCFGIEIRCFLKRDNRLGIEDYI